jgi:hypothetical protein
MYIGTQVGVCAHAGRQRVQKYATHKKPFDPYRQSMFADEADAHDNNVLVGVHGRGVNVEMHDEHGHESKLHTPTNVRLRVCVPQMMT